MKRIENERTPKIKSLLPKTITESEDQTMDQKNGLKANVFREDTRTTLTMDTRELSPHFFGLSLPDKTQHTGTTIRLTEHHMINAQINHSVATMELGLEIDLSTIRMEIGKKLKVFLDLHRLWREISQRTINTPNQKMINLTIVPSADLTIHWRVVSHLTNRKFHKTITKCHPMRSVLIQPTTPILNYQTFARYTTKVCEHELW